MRGTDPAPGAGDRADRRRPPHAGERPHKQTPVVRPRRSRNVCICFVLASLIRRGRRGVLVGRCVVVVSARKMMFGSCSSRYRPRPVCVRRVESARTLRHGKPHVRGIANRGKRRSSCLCRRRPPAPRLGSRFARIFNGCALTLVQVVVLPRDRLARAIAYQLGVLALASAHLIVVSRSSSIIEGVVERAPWAPCSCWTATSHLARPGDRPPA